LGEQYRYRTEWHSLLLIACKILNRLVHLTISFFYTPREVVFGLEPCRGAWGFSPHRPIYTAVRISRECPSIGCIRLKCDGAVWLVVSRRYDLSPSLTHTHTHTHIYTHSHIHTHSHSHSHTPHIHTHTHPHTPHTHTHTHTHTPHTHTHHTHKPMIVGLPCASRQLVTADFEGFGFNT
jgi:hypothetical protein